jgi:hypothetical protein
MRIQVPGNLIMPQKDSRENSRSAGSLLKPNDLKKEDWVEHKNNTSQGGLHHPSHLKSLLDENVSQEIKHRMIFPDALTRTSHLKENNVSSDHNSINNQSQ